MELTGNVPSQAEKAQLWEALFNTEVWKESIPADKYELVGDNLYEMSVEADIGPIKGTQTVKIQFSDLQPPESCNFDVQHQLVKSAQGTLELLDPASVTTEEGAEAPEIPEGTKTVLVYKIKADMGNPIFNAVLDGFKGKIKEGFEELLGRVEQKAHAQQGG